MAELRRGMWQTETIDKTATTKSGNYGAKPAAMSKDGVSKSENYLINRGADKDPNIPNEVSEYRQEELVRATSAGRAVSNKISHSPVIAHSSSFKRNQEMKEKYGFEKTADSIMSGARINPSVGGSVRQAPEIYSPLFQIANLQLPRDRITMNAWNRNFYDTHPLVHNLINLHATYPINKINIKCKNRKIENFFNEMVEEIGLIQVLQNVALEFWKLGEKCSMNSMVYMADGSLKKIIDVKIGDVVLTHKGNKKKVIDRFVKPTNTIIEEQLKIYKIWVGGLTEPLIISGNHPILSTSGSSILCTTNSCKNKHMRILPTIKKCSNCHKDNSNLNILPDFKKAGDIKVKDLVYSPFNKDIIENSEFTNDLCYLMGFWLAEGCYNKYDKEEYKKYNGIKFTNFDGKFLSDKIEPLIKKCFNNSGNLYISKSNRFCINKDKFQYIYDGEKRNGPKLAEFFLKHCGEYSKTKKLSEEVMNLPSYLQMSLLAGFIDGDGCVDKTNGHIIICTSSQNLANQFSLILRRAGIRTKMSKQMSRTEGRETGNYNYRIKVLASDAKNIFCELLKSEKVNDLRETKWSSMQSVIQDNWQVLTIKKIEDITNQFTDSFMYDLEVEDDHSYVANGIAIHNCFPYAELDENKGIWKSIIIQNPDYIHVKTSVLSGQPVISMRPDAALQRLVQSNNPADIQLRSQISDEVLYHIRKGNNIPLDNFHVSHLKLLSSPYDTHGTSVIVGIYKDLMLYDKLRESKFAQADNLVNPITLIKVGGAAEGEYHPTGDDLENWRQTMECYDEETEVLTNEGFKKYYEVIDYIPNVDGGYKATTRPGIKIACFNKDTEYVEYHEPTASHVHDYDGEMYHFIGDKVNIKVTPNHRMLVSRKLKHGWSDWEITKAEELSDTNYRFRAVANWEGKEQDQVSIKDYKIPMDDYLKFLGYVISEGYVCKINKKYMNSISITQDTNSIILPSIKNSMTKIAEYMGKEVKSSIYKQNDGFSKDNEIWKGFIYDSALTRHIYEEIGENEKCNSYNKRIPRWIFNLSKRQIQILLGSLTDGDAHIYRNADDTRGFLYSTISSNLADDVQELVFLCGFAPKKFLRKNGQGKEYFTVSWTESTRGRFPYFRKNITARCSHLIKENYIGKVWCFTVPTDLFITRRQNSLIIQGNSAQYDKDFKIISHAGVTIERVGASGSIIDISNDMNFILDNIFYGLMVPKAIITQEGAAFNSASLGLEVLKQRYESFRDLMAQWLTKKIFAPISEIQEFYEYEGGEKKLIVPEIEWNKMILYDMDNYINTLKELATNNKVSQQTLYKSLGLNMDQENRLIKEEMIKQAILVKELDIINGMTLGALRALKPDQDIIEPTEAPLPGTVSGMGEEAGIPGVGVPGGGIGGLLGGPAGGLGGGLGGGMGVPGPGGGELGAPGGLTPPTIPGAGGALGPIAPGATSPAGAGAGGGGGAGTLPPAGV